NYPNPFNSQTRIRFDLPVLSNVKLVIYNQLGQELFKLIDNEQLASGSYEAEFDATNLSSGVYFYRLMTDGYTNTRKMILVK
ncbi:MAG: T9SS type A sorting domain-containing protein, partial [Ignavibacteria bacterium]|nr:T9SS type A sorting domain-containing protein [Ignavibacteria bacterium]